MHRLDPPHRLLTGTRLIRLGPSGVVVTGLVALAVLLSSCADDGGEDGRAVERQADSAPTDDASSSMTTDGDTPSVVDVLPIDELLGVSSDPAEVARAYGDAYQAAAEATDACMAAAGFDWRTEPSPPPSVAGVARVYGGGGSSDTYAEVGYGIAFGLRTMVEPTVPPDAEAPAADRPAADSPEGEALYRQLGECSRTANEAHPTPLEAVPVAVVQEIGEVRQQIEEDPSIAALWAEWSGCMAEAGYDAVDRDDAIDDVRARAGGLEAEVMAIAQSAGMSGEPPVAPPEVVAQLDELAEFELTVAAADVDCAEALDLDRRLRVERERLEQAFVDEHGERLALAIAEFRAGS